MTSDDARFLIGLRASGSLSAYARNARVAISTVSRRLVAIESNVGFIVVNRARDGLTFTDEGRRLLAAAERFSLEAERFDRAVDALRVGTTVPVIVSSTEPIIAEVLAPRIGRLLLTNPGLRIELHSENMIASLAAREADIAVRLAQPVGASLIARRICDIPMGLFAAASWHSVAVGQAASRGQKPLLVYDDSYGQLPEMAWLHDNRMEDQVVARSNSTRALACMAQGEGGIALLPVFMAKNLGLVRVLEEIEPPARSVWLVQHPDLSRRRDILGVKRWITECLIEVVRH